MNRTLLRTNVANSVGFALLLMLLGGPAFSVRAADESPGASPVTADQRKRPPDLTFQLPLEVGDSETAQFRAIVPGFALGGVKLHPNSDKTRFMIGVRFTSKSVRSARLKVTLLESYKDSQSMDHFTHVEAVGPEEVTTKGKNLDLVRRWDDERALWFDLPLDARKAKAFRIEVHLTGNDDSGG